MTRRTVAVTGVGVVAPCGLGLDDFWKGLLTPQDPGFRELTDWDATPWFENAKAKRRADRFAQFSVAAADMALDQAGDLDADPRRIGVLIGTGIGGIGTNETEIVKQHEKGPRRVSPFLVPMMMPNAAAAAVSIRHGFQGPCETTVTACAAGTHSIGNGARSIQQGYADVVLAGGSEAPFTPTSVAGFSNMTALSKSGVSCPFDERRDGFVMGEGAAVLVLEELELAKARGANILGLVLGSGSTADASHITAPSPEGEGAIRSMSLALQDAGISPSEVRHINAHGTSTPLNDSAESKATHTVFGDACPPITSTKGVTGHSLGAAGALEVAAVLGAIQNRQLPPTMGLENVDPELPELDFVKGEPRDWEPGPAISNSFGFGGHNGTVVIAPAP